MSTQTKKTVWEPIMYVNTSHAALFIYIFSRGAVDWMLTESMLSGMAED